MSNTDGPQLFSSTSTIACGGAEFTTFWLPPEEAVINVRGDIDMRNATEFVDYAWRSGRINHLIVDLTECGFFGTAGFTALHRLHERCEGEGIRWALVPSRTVRRVVDLCDEDVTLPVHATVHSALAAHSS